ncbi:Tn3 family transposase [Clostridium estertheticum]|uniref:Tn3 family transposase n=1 Tax=Clostridium estertheticum TaxID=238834 RepID=UPI00192DFBC0
MGARVITNFAELYPIQFSGECSRSLSNCIIYYNASILSNMLDYRESNGKDLDVLKHISPVAWQHINLYGRY